MEKHTFIYEAQDLKKGNVFQCKMMSLLDNLDMQQTITESHGEKITEPSHDHIWQRNPLSNDVMMSNALCEELCSL